MFGTATIIAPGLLGSSLAQALHREQLAGAVRVWARRAEVRLRCADQPWCAAAPTRIEEAVEGADLIVLCPPVEVIPDLLATLGPALAEGALLTDVGSVKSEICRSAPLKLPAHATFVGAHPMAGSEKSGDAHADPDLFYGQPCLVTPLPDTPEAATERIVALWERLGMNVTTLSPEAHDEIVAHISHLPHLLATTLCTLLAHRDPAWARFAGNGLRDTTRVAAGDPGLWLAIVRQNREEIRRALDAFADEIHGLQRAVTNGEDHEIASRLEVGKVYRDRLPPPARS